MNMDTDTSFPDTTPSIGELSAQFAKQKRPRSPPLAFEPTPNDSLAPLSSPTRPDLGRLDRLSISSPTMGRLSPGHADEMQDLQLVIDQQASALQLLHDAFAAERRSWSLERERLHDRIASLEKLLKNADGHSPAKSPILSPLTGSSLTSPNSKPLTSQSRLPSIAEDENVVPLSWRREGAPRSIDFSRIASQAEQEQKRTDRNASEDFEASASELIVEEIPASPTQTAKASSPRPFNYSMEAGHTPHHAPRRPVSLPQSSMTHDGTDETPRRNTTHIDTHPVRSNHEDDDRALTGPLSMPELPLVPSDANFTFDMLSKKLEQIEKDGDTAKPTIFKQPSPGMVSPSDERGDQISPKTTYTEDMDLPHAAPPTRAPEISSNALSPTISVTSPVPIDMSRDDKVQADFEHGGIRLKKRPSTNFGAPWGSLSGGFGGMRKH